MSVGILIWLSHKQIIQFFFLKVASFPKLFGPYYIKNRLNYFQAPPPPFFLFLWSLILSLLLILKLARQHYGPLENSIHIQNLFFNINFVFIHVRPKGMFLHYFRLNLIWIEQTNTHKFFPMIFLLIIYSVNYI